MATTTRGTALVFPFTTLTRAGSKVLIFAYAVGQERPWLGAYLIDNQYVPMSWLGNGRFSSDGERAADVPTLEEKEKQLGNKTMD